MDHALTLVLGLLFSLFDLVVAAIAAIERAARHGLSSVGITGELQTAILVILGLMLIVAAFRLLGRLIAVLLAIALLLLLLHALFAGHASLNA